MRNLLVVIILLLLPSLALAGGFELYEATAQGVGTAGAQAAEVDEPGCIFYNPAKMTYIHGWEGNAAVNVLDTTTKITAPPNMGQNAQSHITTAAPELYGVQRIGSRFAIGLGGFSNMAEIFQYPSGPNFGGRFLGYQINLTTLTFQPTFAFRPVPWLSIGVGIDIVPASIEIRQAINFGSAEGDAHASGATTGVGGNVGLFIRAVPRWLDLAFTYRSSIDLDFTGKAALIVPPELSMMASSFQNVSTSITLPHNFTFAVGSHLLPHLSADFDVHLTLWDSFKSLTLTFTDPNAPPGTPATSQGQALNFNISYGLRLGFEYRLVKDRLRLRIGGGYERTPVPRASLRPLSADADRGLFGFGLGYRYKWLGFDVAYLLEYLPSRVSADPTYPASYQSIGHIIAIGGTLHFENFGMKIKDAAFKD